MINITASNNTNNFKCTGRVAFKGYDARPLKGVVMTICDNSDSFGIIKQMSQIGKKENFDVYFASHNTKPTTNLSKIKSFFDDFNNAFSEWVQDDVLIGPDKTVFADGFDDFKMLSKKIASITKGKTIELKKRTDGGNIFFAKQNGKECLLIGQSELRGRSCDDFKKLFNVDSVCVLPQSDYHLDLFIRPLNNGRVLIADDSLTVKEIQKGVVKINNYIKKNNVSGSELENLNNVKSELKKLIKEFKNDIKNNENPSACEIENILKSKGFIPLRVPGRLYQTQKDAPYDSLFQSMNYMNSVVHERPDKSLCFITNKSGMNEKCGITKEISEKIGFDFENMFAESLKPFVKKEDIHFISGENDKMAKLLEDGAGGIHCHTLEVPV